MRSPGRLAAFAILVGALAGCRTSPTLTCTSDGDCPGGSCLVSPVSAQRFCAYPESGCPSGLTWSPEAADGLARTCVGGGDGGVTPDAGGPLWTVEESGTTADLHGVSGVDADHLVAVGLRGTVLRRVAGGWRPEMIMVRADLHGVWAAAGGAYAVGAQGTAVSTDWSGGWRVEPTPSGATLRAVYGLGGAGAPVFAVGDGGAALKRSAFGSTGWQSVMLPTMSNLRGLWGTATDFYAVGDPDLLGAAVLHVINGAFAHEAIPTLEGLDAVWGRAGVDSSDVYAVGPAGTIVVGGVGPWAQFPSGTTARLRGVWASDSGDVYVVGDGGLLLHGAGRVGAFVVEPSGVVADLYAVWGQRTSQGDDVYAVGAAGTILHRR